jgi:hypothetical protein
MNSRTRADRRDFTAHPTDRRTTRTRIPAQAPTIRQLRFRHKSSSARLPGQRGLTMFLVPVRTTGRMDLRTRAGLRDFTAPRTDRRMILSRIPDRAPTIRQLRFRPRSSSVRLPGQSPPKTFPVPVRTTGRMDWRPKAGLPHSTAHRTDRRTTSTRRLDRAPTNRLPHHRARSSSAHHRAPTA